MNNNDLESEWKNGIELYPALNFDQVVLSVSVLNFISAIIISDTEGMLTTVSAPTVKYEKDQRKTDNRAFKKICVNSVDGILHQPTTSSSNGISCL